MITLERKKIKNSRYFYLTERVRVGATYKKIQVFVGKHVPNDTARHYHALMHKEIALVRHQLRATRYETVAMPIALLEQVEQARIRWKYHMAQLTAREQARTLRTIAVRFIYESNAIEGSRLSEQEVSAIINSKYVKKSIPRVEVLEVENAIRAFELIREPAFRLSHASIKRLHALVTAGLGIPQGFKTQAIIVNNKPTSAPRDVRAHLTALASWHRTTKKTVHPFVRAALFHNRFEYIHPFADGNGRVGRLLLNWMLLTNGYGYMLIRNKNRTTYFNALNKGDAGRYRNILVFAAHAYIDTVHELLHDNNPTGAV